MNGQWDGSDAVMAVILFCVFVVSIPVTLHIMDYFWPKKVK